MKKIINVAHHRNGVSGNPFYVVTFRDGRQKMLGIVFEEQQGTVAVFDSELLSQGVIAFGENSWRGDDYETFLRAAAKHCDDKLRAADRDRGCNGRREGDLEQVVSVTATDAGTGTGD